MTDYGVIETGFLAKTYDEVLDSLMTNAREIFGYDMDLSVNTKLGQELRSVAVEITELWQQLEGTYYSGYISSAEGQSLDRVVALVGIKRTEATYATGIVSFNIDDALSEDLIIPEGTIVGTEDESILFETSEEGTLFSGDTSVEIAIVAQEKGSDGNVSGGTITNLISSISGIDTISNDLAMTGGGDAEPDADLRVRAMTMKPSAQGTVSALESALLALDGVTDVNIVEDTDEHTVSIAVAGGESGEIEDVIEDTRPCGISVTWDYATGVSIDVTVTVVKTESATEAATQAQVSAAISDWISDKEIGEAISYYKLLLAVSECSLVANISSLSITDGTDTADAIGETVAVDEFKRAEEGTITVNVT